jgi:hypothetical protein
MSMPLRFNRAGQPEPMGVRAAAAKMAVLVAASEKGAELTADEVRIVSAVASFFADEYDRISTDNERLTRDVGELRSQVQALETRLMEIARMAQTEVGE